jgi:hypothetical protein
VDSAIEVRYAGVAVGRATQVRDWTATGGFLAFAEPLPTGTRVELRGEGLRQVARVEDVIESADPAVTGMRVRFVAEGAAEPMVAAAPAPAPAAAAPAAPEAAAPEPAAPEPSEASAASEPSEASAAPEPVDSGPNAASGGGGKRRRRRR